MDRRQQDTRAQRNWAPSHVSKPRRRSRHSAKGARAERDDKPRFHQGKLPVQPPAAVIDLARARRLVNAPLSTRDELEMLDRIREIALAFRETRLTQSRAQEPARRSDKRTTLEILLIPGLLADEDRTRTGRTFAEDCLRRAIAKRTETTSFRLAQERLVCVGGLLEPSGLAKRAATLAAPGSTFDGGAATICAARGRAVDDIAGIWRVSGRLAQYFFGISLSMARFISRAGLKIDR